MKLNRCLHVFPLLLILLLASTTRAQETKETEPPKYRMELIWVADGDEGDAEYIFLIGSVGFKTVEGMKKFVAGLAAGSVIEWAPGCLRRGNEPLLSSAEEMEAWRKFCEEHAIQFILIPSG